MKRFFDVIVSLAGLLMAAPFMAVIAALIKLESRGAVFYRCTRVGKDGKLFGMLKFRTMIQNADAVDCALCKGNDVRVTSFGMFLRRTKLNELPQLFNVLVGDMSMVGPRPEDPKFVDCSSREWQTVLSVRPAIVGPNQIVNRNEDDLLQAQEDPEAYYIKSLLPEKMRRDIDYVRNQTLWEDLKILLHGVYVTVFKAFRLSRLRERASTLQLMGVDVGLSVIAYVLANLLRHETLPGVYYVWLSFPVIAISNPFIFVFMGLYRCSLRFFSVPDMIRVGKVCLMSAGWLVTASYLTMVGSGHSRVVYALYPAIMFLLIGGSRVIIRSFMEKREQQNGDSTPDRVLIYGAGRLGVETFKRLQFEPGIEVAGFVDDDPGMKGKSLLGAEVLGSGSDLAHLKVLHGVRGVVLAFKPVIEGDFAKARQRCIQAEVENFVSPATLWNFPGDHSDQKKVQDPCRESSDLAGLSTPPDSDALTESGVEHLRITG